LGFPAKTRTGTLYSLHFIAPRDIMLKKVWTLKRYFASWKVGFLGLNKVLFQLEIWLFRLKEGTFSARNFAF
jgi:hypothetical protein